MEVLSMIVVAKSVTIYSPIFHERRRSDPRACARAQSGCMTYPPSSTAFAALGGLSFKVTIFRWLKGVGKKSHIR